MRGSRLLAGLLAALATFAMSCEDGASPGPSPTAQSETPAVVSSPTSQRETPTVVSSPTSQTETTTPAATAIPPPTAEGLDIVPAIPDPFELYVMKADGSERKLLSVSPGATRLLWSPAGDRAAVITIVSRETTELRFVTMPDGVTQGTVVASGHVQSWWWSPRWSPTGAWLAYIRSSQESAVLEVIQADGSGREELTVSEGDVQGLDIAGWTNPDTLLATRWDGTRSVVMEFNLATGERREVTTLGGRSYATMSNDRGMMAAIVSAVGKTCERGGMSNTLWLVDAATGQSRRAVGETCYLGASVAWSPDDSQIAYSVAPGPDDPAGVYVLDVASGNTRILGGGVGHINDSVVSWLEDGSGVLVRRSDCYGCTPGTPSLVFMPAVGGEQLIVDHAEFAPSPNTRKVLVAKDGLRVSAIGGVSQTLAPPDFVWTGYLLSNLGWSPDGEWLSFVRYNGDGVRQFEVNADGSDLTRLPNLDSPPPSRPAGPTARVPSPDGARVAVLGFRLTIEDTRSGQSVTVDAPVPLDASWAPNGETLVFSARVYSANGRSDIYIVSASGTGLRPLTSNPNSESGTAFSPDGREVAFVRWGAGGPQVVAIDVDTGQERPLFAAEEVGADIYDGPVWSPDGKLLTVLAKTPDGKGIYIVRADGTGAYRIVATDPSGAYHVAGMRWENGNRLYFVTWTELGD